MLPPIKRCTGQYSFTPPFIMALRAALFGRTKFVFDVVTIRLLSLLSVFFHAGKLSWFSSMECWSLHIQCFRTHKSCLKHRPCFQRTLYLRRCRLLQVISSNRPFSQRMEVQRLKSHSHKVINVFLIDFPMTLFSLCCAWRTMRSNRYCSVSVLSRLSKQRMFYTSCAALRKLGGKERHIFERETQSRVQTGHTIGVCHQFSPRLCSVVQVVRSVILGHPFGRGCNF